MSIRLFEISVSSSQSNFPVGIHQVSSNVGLLLSQYCSAVSEEAHVHYILGHLGLEFYAFRDSEVNEFECPVLEVEAANLSVLSFVVVENQACKLTLRSDKNFDLVWLQWSQATAHPRFENVRVFNGAIFNLITTQFDSVFPDSTSGTNN